MCSSPYHIWDEWNWCIMPKAGLFVKVFYEYKEVIFVNVNIIFVNYLFRYVVHSHALLYFVIIFKCVLCTIW